MKTTDLNGNFRNKTIYFFLFLPKPVSEYIYGSTQCNVFFVTSGNGRRRLGEGFVFSCRVGCLWGYHRVWIVRLTITLINRETGTGEPLHRLEPVPVRGFTGTGWSVQQMTSMEKSQNEECWTLSPNSTNTYSSEHEL
jgi:hypothetical protein